jgi:hypothetical protein
MDKYLRIQRLSGKAFSAAGRTAVGDSAAGTAFEEALCVTLAALLDQLLSVGLIHCDVQDAEYQLLRAARRVSDAESWERIHDGSRPIFGISLPPWA